MDDYLVDDYLARARRLANETDTALDAGRHQDAIVLSTAAIANALVSIAGTMDTGVKVRQ